MKKIERNVLPPIGTYIIICDIAYISGGPIYCRNKAQYMHEQGWDVIIIPTRNAKSRIEGMNDFSTISFPFINSNPNVFSLKTRAKFIDAICAELHIDRLPIVIETGTDYTALWGELLSEKLQAKHIVEFEDEYNQHVNNKTFQFYKFKFDRKELACISKEAMKHIFGPFWHIDDSNAVALPFVCTNVIEDYSSQVLATIPASEHIIGYIGRTNKPFVKNIVKGVLEFALSHPNMAISFIMFGGPKTKQSKLIECPIPANLHILITDFIFPLPLQDLKKCDVFMAGAGSAVVGVKTGKPTINVDQYTHEPTGFMVNATSWTFYRCKCGNSIAAHLEQILVHKDIPFMEDFDFTQEHEHIKAMLSQHVDFLNRSDSTQEYFPIDMIPLQNFKQKIRKEIYRYLPLSWIYKIERFKYVKPA